MSSAFFRSAAQQILSRHAAPDLRGARVLLPNYHAALPLAQALSAVSSSPALLLPQMQTLADWVQSVPQDGPVQSDTQRIAVLYKMLRERKWFPDANLWRLSREILALMDELHVHQVRPADASDEFARQLAQAYRSPCGQAMQFEASVVHELWCQINHFAVPDASAAYQLRLDSLAQQPILPLYVLQTADLSAPEARFLDACREKVEVTVFDLREMAADDPSCTLLVRALQPGGDDLLSAAAGLKPCAMLNSAPDSRALSLFGAHGQEQEAQAADVQIRRWLLDGRKSIAVVVQDKLVASRLRALLERAQVSVQDETGCPFATLSVSTVLMRWLTAVQDNFYYQDVLDLLKSTFLFADEPSLRKQAAYQFEQMVRKHGVIAHLQDFISVAERHCPELLPALTRLQQASDVLRKPVREEANGAPCHLPLSAWLVALQESLELLGVIQGWRQDAAGVQLQQQLLQWQEELSSDTTACSFAEWRRWLAQQLDLSSCRDLSVESPVLFMHLPATRWRIFDAVLLLGADATHLPSPVKAGQWFNDRVRATLGLPLSTAAQTQVRDDLLALLAMNDTVLATWQASCNGEPNMLSPYLEMINALHLLAFGGDLMNTELGGMLAWAQVRIQDAGCRIQDAGTMPRPVIPADLIPARISPSSYNSLVACPYQYYARHVLKLNDLDEVREELDKRDYGTWVHAVLQQFHMQVPDVTARGLSDAEQVLRDISEQVFAAGLAHDYLAQAWLLRWQALIPAYLDWQLENEAAGWIYQAGEVPIEIEVAENLVLRGRLDRIDRHAGDAEKRQVFDYKTQSAAGLKNKLKEPGEDVQLACYATMANAALAAFVSLDGEKVISVAPSHDVPDLAQQNVERLQTVFALMRDGAGLPAHGADPVCGYCEMRGLCRRGAWELSQDSGVRMQDVENGKPETVNGVHHG
ncbi:MAG: PD-(D/E)XK nuclease family protein [Gallionella sp.]|nr:PD-(D/E)XK nuclease family protein [Gallionella sp.]